MALTRKALKAMGLTDEQVDSVIEMHTETVDGLKAQINEQKETVANLTKERDDLKSASKTNVEDDDKYKALKKEYDDYKKDVETKATKAKVETAYRELLKKAGIAEKYIPSIIKVTDLSREKLNKDGELENAETLKASALKEYPEFVTKDGKKGADTSTPPENNGGKAKTKEEIMKIKDTTERQQAWAEYLNGQNE